MSLRLRDFLCKVCGREWERIALAEAPDPKCCGEVATRIWKKAPGMAITPSGYSTQTGSYVTGTRDRDRQLTKKNRWIPSKQEVEELLHTPSEEVFRPKLDRQKIKEVALKKASELHGVGKFPAPC